MKRIVLMYDGSSSAYAGAEVFFINTASELSRRGFEITLVDLPDSIIPRHLKEHGIPFKFVPFRKGRRIDIAGRQDYLMVTNTKIFHCCRLNLNKDCKVLVVEIDKDFWDDRHKGKSLFGWISNFTMRRWRQCLIDNGGLAVLEASAVELAASRGYRNVERMGRIPLMVPPVPKYTRVRQLQKADQLRFLGIARDAEYKIAPLAYFFPKFRAALPGATFKFVTHNTSHAREVFSKFGVDFVECVPGMPPEELNAFIDREADCVVAMGTTSLNAATLGVPTLVADASNEWPYPTDRFRWVHDSHENLGEYITSTDKPSYGIGVSEAVAALCDDYAQLSSSAARFVSENHSPKVFASAICDALGASAMNFGRYVLQTRFGVVR